jgi:hypothetical protein
MEGHAGHDAHLDVLRLAIISVFLGLMLGAPALAQPSGGFPHVLPNATIISDEPQPAHKSESSPDEDARPTVATAPPAHPYAHHHATISEPTYSAAVEPTHARLKIKNDTWAYAGPQASSPTLERVHSGKFLDVTGSTHYFLQVKLKSGSTGYVPISAVELTHPEDKIMRLSTDAAVLSQPNRYGKRLSEVHQGHDIHVVGVSMNYMKIRMKSGLEGYVPMTAAE